MKELRTDTIRARINGRRMTAIVPQKYPWRPRRESWVHWYLAVTDGNRILAQDDCRDLAVLHTLATEYVCAFRTIKRIGYKI